jgi:hypothetical protein
MESEEATTRHLGNSQNIYSPRPPGKDIVRVTKRVETRREMGKIGAVSSVTRDSGEKPVIAANGLMPIANKKIETTTARPTFFKYILGERG